MKNARKVLLLVLCLVLVVSATVMGTLAYLTDQTEDVVNTFTIGKVDITLAETTGQQYKMVPGNDISKDPKVTVTAGSEDSWVFVQVTEGNSLGNYITYSVADGWTPLPEHAGVYYREYTGTNAAEYPVLTNNKVTVKDTVTNEMMEAVKEALPTLTFKAYAIQKAGFTTAADAWAELNKPAA